jgi:hypothetical protein
MRDDCDGLLFRSLLSVSGNTHINIPDHFKSPFWYRSPDNACPDTTTISRDMMIGLWWWLWRNKEIERAEYLLEYANDHLGKMGRGDPRVYMSPSLYNTLYYIIKRIGGSTKNSKLAVEVAWDRDFKGYKAHIQMLHILLRAEIEGFVQTKEKQVIETTYLREPQNALFAYAYAKFISGDYTPVIQVLLDTNHFPENSLPSNENHCDSWLWGREYSTEKDWTPCPEVKHHSGGDFLFVSNLVLEELK